MEGGQWRRDSGGGTRNRNKQKRTETKRGEIGTRSEREAMRNAIGRGEGRGEGRGKGKGRGKRGEKRGEGRGEGRSEARGVRGAHIACIHFEGFAIFGRGWVYLTNILLIAYTPSINGARETVVHTIVLEGTAAAVVCKGGGGERGGEELR